jgi:hypothetical protein
MEAESILAPFVQQAGLCIAALVANVLICREAGWLLSGARLPGCISAGPEVALFHDKAVSPEAEQ